MVNEQVLPVKATSALVEELALQERAAQAVSEDEAAAEQVPTAVLAVLACSKRYRAEQP